MHRFLIVEHDEYSKLGRIVRKVRVPETEARALPAFEAISTGLMPPEFSLAWHDVHGQSTLRMTYRTSVGHRLLVGDPRGCDTHDPFNPRHIEECSRAINGYRYTWYEAPDDQAVRVTFIERHYDLSEPIRFFSHGMRIDGTTVSMPPDVQFTAQGKASQASYRTSWWQPEK